MSDLTPEDKIFARYLELGDQIKSLSAERDGIKETELIPNMLDGMMFSLDGQYARFEYVEVPTFDYKSARANGDISDEVWNRYTSVSVQRKLMVRKLKDDSQAQTEQQVLAECAKVAKTVRQG